MKEFFEQEILKFLKINGVDIYNYDYKNSENFVKIRDDRIFAGNNGFMSLDEYIERFLLQKDDLINTYESIYDIGNPYELADDECSYTALANEITRISNFNVKNQIERWAKSNDKMDRVAAAEAIKAQEEETKELAKLFNRKGGYLEQLKNHLNLDLELFDMNNQKYKCEKFKILYLFFQLKNKYFPKTKVMALLNEPSMESIDNSLLGWSTNNGNIIKFLKHSLEKELNLTAKKQIKNTVCQIVSEWSNILYNSKLLVNFLCEKNDKYDFEETIFSLKNKQKKISTSSTGMKFTHSPIETLYLKVVQHEYLGNIKDISKINNIQTEIDYKIPSAFINQMKNLDCNTIEINDVEKYIDDNAFIIAKYVYLKESTNKEERRKIRTYKKKVIIWLNFCIRAQPLFNLNGEVPELLIISCLQTIILDSQNETFDYTPYGYQDHIKHKPQVQAALKNDIENKNTRALDALQIYWVRKVTDRYYINLGKYEIRRKVRALENICDSIMEEILSIPNLDEMLKTHKNYIMNVGDELITTNEQIQAVKVFEQYLHKKGFKYIDDFYKIRYAFLYPPSNKSIHYGILKNLDYTLIDKDPVLDLTVQSLTANAENELELNYKFLFDYQNNVCTMSEFEQHNL